MALIQFKDLPDTTTPLDSENMNNNFNELSSGISNLDTELSSSISVLNTEISNLNNNLNIIETEVNKLNSDVTGLKDKLISESMAIGKEVKTSELYNDKPIYRKMILIPSLPNNTTGSYSHGVPNLGDLYVIDLSMSYWAKGVESFSFIFGDYIRGLTLKKDSIQIVTLKDATSYVGVITIKYTKAE